MKVLANRVKEREEFVKLAINKPQEAAKILKIKAKALEKSHRIGDTTKVLSETIFVSERTLFLDLAK
jgi:hypothetical protein